MSKIDLAKFQTMAEAAQECGCSRQRIYQVVAERNLKIKRAFGRTLVQKPFPHVIDKAYQVRAKQSKNH